MEQQCLKHVTAKKESDGIQKEDEVECKRREDEQRRKSKEVAPLVSSTQSSKMEIMQVDGRNPGINSLLADMMQGDNDDKQVEVIDPEARSPTKNKHKNNRPHLKPSATTSAVSEKSVHTKLDKYKHKNPHIVVEASIKLSNANPFQEFVVYLQNLLKHGQLVDPFFAFRPVKSWCAEKKIHKLAGIPLIMTMLDAHFKFLSNGHNPFEKQKVWGKGANKNKDN